MAVLARVPLFTGLSAAEIKAFVALARLQSFRTGEVIFHKDDAGHTLHVILQGVVKIYLVSEGGQEAVLVILKAGEFFGELSLLDGAPRSASAMALEPTLTIAINRDNFLSFIREQPEAALSIFGVLASRLRRADGIIADAAFLDLPARVTKTLLDLAATFGRETEHGLEIDLRLRQQDFAAMVGATRESVNRVLAGLEEEKLVRLDRQHITVLDLQALRQRLT